MIVKRVTPTRITFPRLHLKSVRELPLSFNLAVLSSYTTGLLSRLCDFLPASPQYAVQPTLLTLISSETTYLFTDQLVCLHLTRQGPQQTERFLVAAKRLCVSLESSRESKSEEIDLHSRD